MNTMPYISILLKCLFIGFAIAAPIGSVGILCINRALHDGFKSAFITGLGAAVGDTIFGCIAAFGLTVIADFITNEQVWLRLIGGGIIIIAGYQTFRRGHIEYHHKPQKQYANHFFTSIVMTVTNPITIVAFIGVFAAVGIGNYPLNYLQTGSLVFAIFIGALAWWFLLSVGISYFRDKFTPRLLIRINHIAGIALITLGLWALCSGIFKIRDFW